MTAYFNRFTLSMTLAEALSASHPGPCDVDVEELTRKPKIRRQLDKLNPDTVIDELREYGAWEDDELFDHARNLRRVVWLAACDIAEEHHARCNSRLNGQRRPGS